MILNNINIKEDYILNDYSGTSWSQAIIDLCKPLIEDKVVKEGYPHAVIEREKLWPTGLPTQPIGVAIPHADGKNLVLKSSLAIAILKEPIKFNEAGGDSEKTVDVKIIFLICMESPEGQLVLLQALNKLFIHGKYLSEMGDAKSPNEVIKILSEIKM